MKNRLTKYLFLFLGFLFISYGCSKEKQTSQNEFGDSIVNSDPNQTTWLEVLKGMHIWNIEVGSSLNPDYTKSTHAYLCSNGYFYMSVVDHITGSEFEGVWSVGNENISQASTLQVQFSDGDIVYYQLVYQNGKLYVEQTNFQFEYITDQC